MSPCQNGAKTHESPRKPPRCWPVATSHLSMLGTVLKRGSRKGTGCSVIKNWPSSEKEAARREVLGQTRSFHATSNVFTCWPVAVSHNTINGDEVVRRFWLYVWVRPARSLPSGEKASGSALPKGASSSTTSRPRSTSHKQLVEVFHDPTASILPSGEKTPAEGTHWVASAVTRQISFPEGSATRETAQE